MENYTRVFSSNDLFIGVSGIIGVGKTYLTRELGNKLNFRSYFEPVKENPYLSLFYDDMYKYAFPMQVYLLNKRFHQHQQAVWCGQGVVQDRTIYEDVIFAKMLAESKHIDDLNFDTYRELFINMTNYLHRPDVIVYLDVEPETAMKRIATRGRDCEKTLSLDYLKALRDGYEDWIKDINTRIPVIRIDWNEFKSVDYVMGKINECLGRQRKTQLSV